MNQRKCPHCGTWNEGNVKNCGSCSQVIDEKIIREEQKKQRMTQAELRERLSEQPDWLNRLFTKLQASKNPFSLLAYHVLNAMWFVYFSILIFIVWLVTLAAG